jgi:hypothetical protein
MPKKGRKFTQHSGNAGRTTAVDRDSCSLSDAKRSGTMPISPRRRSPGHTDRKGMFCTCRANLTENLAKGSFVLEKCMETRL